MSSSPSATLGSIRRSVGSALRKAGLRQRDTDTDWRALGDSDPFWGVLTDEKYRSAAIGPEAIKEFYATGAGEMAGLVALAEQTLHHPIRAARALDFGCGVGRLTEAIAAYADEVVGVDISEGMLAQARAHKSERTRYASELPDERFDWINSFIVFQHIPPSRGLKLLDRLLERTAPTALLTLQFCIYSEPLHKGPGRLAPKRLDGSWRHRLMMAQRPKGTVMMYDYDLTEIFQRLASNGFHVVSLFHTDHGGHHGVHIISERGSA